MNDGDDRMPLVTVGIPTFNNLAGMKERYRSILNQTYPNLEILISDNCSTEYDPQSLYQEQIFKEHRTRVVIQEQNIGAYANFLCLLSQARGRFFLWAADDDNCTPDYIEKLVAPMVKDERILFSFSQFKSVYLLDGRVKDRYFEPEFELIGKHGPFVDAIVMHAYTKSNFYYGIYDTQALRLISAHLPRCFDFQDVFVIQYFSLIGRIAYVPEILFQTGIKQTERTVYSVEKNHGLLKLSYGTFFFRSLHSIFFLSQLHFMERVKIALVFALRLMALLLHYESGSKWTGLLRDRLLEIRSRLTARFLRR